MLNALKCGLLIVLIVCAPPVAVTYLVVQFGHSGLYQPSPSGRVSVQAQQQPPSDHEEESQPDQRGTEKTPIVVKLQNTPKTQGEADQDADYQERKTADDRIYRQGWWSIGIGLAQTVALIATFLVIAYVAVRELRAYVYCDFSITRFSLTKGVEFTGVMRNAGKTPARHFEAHGVAFISGLPLPDETRMPDPGEDPSVGRHSRLSLYPGTDKHTDYELIDELNAEVIEALTVSPPRVAIYVAGAAYYRDVFNKRRRTEFCVYVNPVDAVDLLAAAKKDEIKKPQARFISSHLFNEFT